MSSTLSTKSVEVLLAALRKAARREECWTCDCLQGFLTQLEMDAEPAGAELIAPLKVSSTQMHRCLGCDPCPPGAVFADYLRGMNQKADDTECRDSGCCCKDNKEQSENE